MSDSTQPSQENIIEGDFSLQPGAQMGVMMTVATEPPSDRDYIQTMNLTFLEHEHNGVATRELAQMWIARKKGDPHLWVLIPVMTMTQG